MDENKDYIINIRVSRDTYQKLRNKARENKESISNLVRKSINDSREIIEDLKREIFGADSKRDEPKYDFFQDVIMAKETSCQRCGALIFKGSRAFVGEAKNGDRKYFCTSCFSGI